MLDKPKVTNAANEGQINDAKQREKRGRELEVSDLKNILVTPHGRRFVWRLLERCRVFNSVWEASAKIHYNAGQQDIGHYVLAEVMNADEGAFITMSKENRESN